MGKKKEKISREELEISVLSELTSTQLLIEYPDYYMEDYQLPMLRSNVIPSILKVEIAGLGLSTQFRYEISGMESFQKRFERNKISLEDLQAFLKQFLETTETLQKYMLDANLLLLNPEYIFWKENTCYFCYLPVAEESLLEQFHVLTEFFVRQIDYEEMECVFLAHKLNQKSMEQQYDIRSILKEYEKDALERGKEVPKLQKRESPFVEMEDVPKQTGKFIYEDPESLPDTNRLQDFVSRLTRGLRRKKWGGWQDMLLESDRQDLESIL